MRFIVNSVYGSDGSSGVIALKTKVLKLSTELDVLKGILDGGDNEALSKALATVNALRAGIGNIEVLGVKRPIGGLPGVLTEFTCEP